MKSVVLILLFQFSLFYSDAQLIYRQDVIKGGVTGGGFSGGMTYASGIINVYIEPSSQIKEAKLICYSYRNPPATSYLVNGETVEIEINDFVSIVDFHQPPWLNASPVRIYCKDVTGKINSNSNDISVVIPQQEQANLNESFWAVYLILVYENQNLPEINYSIILNNQPYIGFEQYQINNLNPINSNLPVGFSIFTDRHTNNPLDKTIVTFNSFVLGEIYTVDQINSQHQASGVKGHFYHQNNNFYGLDDDIANQEMNESDGIADVSSYIDFNSTSIDFTLQHVNYPNQQPAFTNVNLAYFLTYTSPCQPFSVTLLTSDTSTCSNFPVQLGVTVPDTINATYEWLPQTNLSCYDCPNPIFLGDSTTNYTVRIRNTDSCSVVYPVRVRVLPNPSFESIEISESVCGGATGNIAVASSGLSQPHSYEINDGLPQNNGTFNNLAAGEYTITVANTNGCSVDSTVVVGEFNNVQAAFSVNPTTGAAPLDISITNQSQNATEYFWDFSDEDGNLLNQVTGHFGSAQCPVAGVYTLTLVAGNGTPHCNDTTSLQIFVYDSLQVVIPNVFTPNSDGTNDWFGITTNISISGKIVLLNRWGNVVQEKSFTTQANSFEPLWNGMDASEGVYFYRIFEIQGEAGEELVLDKKAEFQGFVHLER
jgi:gliding motility-associated-like protein